MPKFFLRGLIFFPIVLVAQVSFGDQTMKSIDDFLANELAISSSGNNPAHLQFIGLRCGALFSILTRYGYDNKMKEQGDSFAKAQKVALSLAMEASVPFNRAFFVGQLEIRVAAYIERWKRAKALTGVFPTTWSFHRT